MHSDQDPHGSSDSSLEQKKEDRLGSRSEHEKNEAASPAPEVESSADANLPHGLRLYLILVAIFLAVFLVRNPASALPSDNIVLNIRADRAGHDHRVDRDPAHY